MNRLKEVRTQKGFSQEALADKIGVRIQTLSRWENGHHSPHRTLLKVLAETLKVKPEELNF